MREVRRQAIEDITAAFRRLERQVPQPTLVTIGGEEALRYVEQTVEQAVILKLARYLSGLNACELLLLGGFVQEQAVLQRTLDEISEDIVYLSLGRQVGLNKDHRRYLSRFWQEELEEGVAPIDSNKPRYQLKRSEIRGWTDRQLGQQTDSKAGKAGAIMAQVYSGYVHAAAPQIMEMCGGEDFRFFTSGLRGSGRIADHATDLWNYTYRGLLAATQVARILGDVETNAFLGEATEAFERASGSTDMRDAKH